MTTPDSTIPLDLPATLDVTIVYVRSNDWICAYLLEVPGAIAQERTREAARRSVLLAARDVLHAHQDAGTDPELADVLSTEVATVDLRR
jgi:hypothetical protein